MYRCYALCCKFNLCLSVIGFSVLLLHRFLSPLEESHKRMIWWLCSSSIVKRMNRKTRCILIFYPFYSFGMGWFFKCVVFVLVCCGFDHLCSLCGPLHFRSINYYLIILIILVHAHLHQVQNMENKSKKNTKWIILAIALSAFFLSFHFERACTQLFA